MFNLSLRTNIALTFLLLVVITTCIQVSVRVYFQLPQLYALETNSDQKDLNRVNEAFNSLVNELEVINYDYTVWTDTYDFIENYNEEYLTDNFIVETFQSLDLNGVVIFNVSGDNIWSSTWDKDGWKPAEFLPFEQPVKFVQKNILITAQDILENNLAPVTKAGFVQVDDRLILFSATSVFHSNAKGGSNGTLLFWKFVDENLINKISVRSGIQFDYQLANSILGPEKLNEIKSAPNFSSGSFRDENGLIHGNYGLFGNAGYLKFSYEAPERLFEPVWLDSVTVVNLLLLTSGIFFVFLLLDMNYIRPIKEANSFIKNVIKSEDASMRIHTTRQDEIGNLFSSFNFFLKLIESKQKKLSSRNQRLHKMSHSDGLTKIANRRALQQFFTSFISSKQSDHIASMIICDIDYFKNYNDSYGHLAGDAALIAVAASLKMNLHEETDIVARIGGEEFAIILANTDLKQALVVAENLRSRIETLEILHEGSMVSEYLTVSMGLTTTTPGNNNSFKSIFSIADKALYEAKSRGRNCVCFHSNDAE